MALASAGAPTAFAATLTVLVDTDNNAATGCTVATANGPFGGVERRFVTTVDTTQNPPQVTGITQENCTAAPGTFSAPVAVSAGGWPVGVGNGTGGYNMIETGLPIGVPGPVRVAVIYSDPAIGEDAVTVGTGGGPIILFSHTPGHIEQVPTLSDAMLALLVALMLAVGWRYGRRLAAAPLVVALVMVTSIAWAAIVLDGLIGDWSGIPAAAADPVDAPPGADISAVFGTIEGTTLFVRVDARTGMPPAAVADTYTAVSGVPLAIVPPAGLLDNDNRGIPAATVTSFGGGSLGGTVTTNAASGTALFGVGGSLTVNAAGGFTYTPATGFTGAFTFSYRISSVNGTSDALVTINTQQAPAITSANAATFNVGSAGTFTVTATGFPAPTLSVSGMLPGGVTFDPATGVLSGTPDPGTANNYPLVFTAANGVAPNATQNFTLTVNQTVSITSANAATFTVGAPGTFTITTSATPVVDLIAITGTLPGGVSLGATSGTGTAVLSGTPDPGTGGTYTVTITASNSGVTPNGTQTFTLTVNQAPAITSANAATFNVGTPGTFTVTTTGFPTGAAMAIGASGTLPGGVTFTDNNDGTGTLAGTPDAGTAASSPYALTFTADNAVAPPASQPFTLTVTDAAVAVDDGYNVVHDMVLNVAAPGVLANDTGTPAPTLVSVNGAPASVGVPTATAAGSVTLNADGSFSYTPNPDTAGPDSFTYGIQNTTGSDTGTVTITVTNALPVVDLNGGAAGIDFAATFTEGLGAVPIVDAAALTVTDADDTQLTGATIVITNLADGPSEALGVICTGLFPVCEGAIQVADVTYTAATGTLEILPPAGAPLADYQTLLRTLTYVNASANPTTTARDVTVTINDGIDDNLPVAHSIVTIAGVNGDPVITAPATANTPVNTALVFAGTVSVADPDAGGANVQVTLAATNGTVTLSGTAGLTVLGNGTASVTSTGPIASQNAALNGMSFNPTPAFSGAATLQIDVSDLGNTGSGGAKTDTHTINITVDTPPAVTTTIPANGATGVSNASTITVNFTENVTVTGASFTIICAPSGSRPFTFSGSGTSQVILTPNTALPAGEVCTVTVVAAQVTDSGAQNPAADHVFSFTVNTLPTVTSTVPTNGATGVTLGSTIVINFSESVAATGTAFTLECPAATPIAFTASASPAASYTLTPTANLPPGTLCAVNVVAAQITDVDGGQNMAANFPFSFTTGVPPAITSANNATFTVGTAGNFSVTTTGTPTVTSIVSASVTPGPGGALPSGVTFSYVSGANATLAGTPANAAQVGTYVLSFTASNGIFPDAVQNPFTLTVACPAITLAPANNSIFAATYNTVFTQAFTPAVGTAPYSYTVGGSLPPGVAFSGDNLTGTPTNTGSFAFTVAAVDANGCTMAAQNYTLNVNPAANADAYNALGNVLVDSATGIAFSVLTNDSFPVGTGTVTGFSAASAQAGTVSVGANGQFTYNPPVGYNGADTFTYTLSSNGQTAVGTVTFTVTGLVWFVSNVSACAVDCNGRLTNPYVNASNFNTDNTGAALKPSTDDAIFFYGGGASYTGAVTLLNGQRVVGQGAAGTLATLGTVAPQNGQTLPTTGGTLPILGGTLTVAQNNFVHGVTLSGNTPAISGSNFGTLTINDNVGINTSGAAMSLATGTLSGSLTTTIASGGTTSISLTTVGTSGTFAFGGGGVTGGSTNGLVINGQNGSFSYNGTISNTLGAQVVSITNKTGGTVTLNGDVGSVAAGRGILVQNNSTGTNTIHFNGLQKRVSSGASAGVNLDNNDGATINFANGGLEIATTSGTGFAAINGATAVNVTGANNTIATTTGTALNVVSTDIGPSDLNFLSISSNGASNGIILNATGTAGGLIVSGTGSTAVGGNNSGGTIQSTTNYGIQLTDTRDVSLTNMNIQSAGRSGIDGQQVTNFTFANGTINNVGTAAAGQYEESNISFNDGGSFLTSSVSGAVSITGSVLTNARRAGIMIENGTGTIGNLTITGNTLTSSIVATTSLGNAIHVLSQGSAATTSHVTTGSISNNTIANFPSGEGIFVAGGSGNTSNNTSATLGANGTPILIQGNAIAGAGGAGRLGSNAIRASFNGQVGVANFNISNNGTLIAPITNIEGQGISVFMGGTVTGTTTINNNFIVANHTLGAGTQGLAVQVDDGPAGLGTSAADYNVIITNNSVSNYEGSGIRAIARASLGKMDVTIQNNTVGTPILANRNGIRVDSGSAAGDTTLCLLMTGNISDGSGVNAGMGIRKQGTVAGTNEFGIVGLAPSPTTGANAAAKVTADNPLGNLTDHISGDNFVSCTITP